jgi:hypothetical protein
MMLTSEKSHAPCSTTWPTCCATPHELDKV